MNPDHIDPETQAISDKNSDLLELVNHHGWRRARQILADKIVELQNVSEYVDIIQTGNATALLREMKANKRAAEILFDFLRQIEGGAQSSIENKVKKTPSHIYKVDED